MSIINITDRERELEKALAEEQKLNSMGAEREYVLRGKIEQLERTLGQSANMIQITAMERDWLKAQLGDLPESQAEMLCEIKVLRDALESYANPSNWDEDLHGIRRWWLEPDSSTRKAGYDLASAALTKKIMSKEVGGPAALPRSSYCVASTGESLYTETEVRRMLAPTAPAMLIEAAPSLLINFNFNDLERDDVRARLKGLAL